MIDLSPIGLLGAVIGTVVAAAVYGPLVGLVGRAFESRQSAQTVEERERSEQELSLLRRVVFAVDVIVLAAIGYWLGQMIGG
jgi:hypothetical protein